MNHVSLKIAESLITFTNPKGIVRRFSLIPPHAYDSFSFTEIKQEASHMRAECPIAAKNDVPREVSAHNIDPHFSSDSLVEDSQQRFHA